MAEWLRQWWGDSFSVFWKICKILIPTLIVLRILQIWQVDLLLAEWLSPSMAIVGLPGYAALVWAAALVGNIYTAIAVLASYWSQQPLSIAQVSILSVMMLIAHSMIVEAIIAKKSGTTIIFSIVWRMLNAYAIGWLTFQICQHFNLWQAIARPLFKTSQTDVSLTIWLLTQLQSIVIMLLVIMAFMALILYLRQIGIEQKLHQSISPLLKLFYLPNSAANITIVGMVLGISYGAGLLIHDIETHKVSRQDGAKVMSILNLNHAVIEDTLLMLLIGASIWIALLQRLLLGLLMSWLYCFAVNHSPLIKRLSVST